ncbi:microcephalin [Hypanus sabinus]|uniref:microcephalin n=1 Tax=Hypanus sabinus TaxID=79690 RepID=UPI0028C3F76F|nr:microcephalin [Hypanus sabinus]
MTSDCSKKPILRDVVAFVDVWSSTKTENYSKSFIEHLVDMGATVLKYFNKQVTHVIFKDGHESVWKKAQKMGVKLVSVLWVERCLVTRSHVDESLFPAKNESKHLFENKRTHRCMKPKDFIEKTPENNKRLQKKFEQMIQELDLKRTSGADVPLLSFEEAAKIKSVPPNHFCEMQERLKEMKEKRENLSPTETDSGGVSVNKTSEQSKTSLSDDYEGQVGQPSWTVPFVQGMHLIKSPQNENKNTLLQRRKKSITKMKLQFLKTSTATSLHHDQVSGGSSNQELNEQYSEGSVKDLNNATADLNLSNALLNKTVQSPPLVKSTATVENHSFRESDFVSNEYYKNYPLQSNISIAPKKNQCSSKKNWKLFKDYFKSSPNNISEASNLPIKEDRLLYEDFFSPVNLKDHQRNKRPSLGMLPPESPSPPRITFGSVKQKRKLQAIHPLNCVDRNKRTKSAASVSVEVQTNASVYKDNESFNTAALTSKNIHVGTNVALQSDTSEIRKRRKSRKELFQCFSNESEESINEVLEKKELRQCHEEKRLDRLPNDPTVSCPLKGKTIPANLHHEPQAHSIISTERSDQKKKKECEIKVQDCQEDKLSKNLLKLQRVDSELDASHQSCPSRSSPLGMEMTCCPNEKHNLNKVMNGPFGCKKQNMKTRRTLVMTSMPSENQVIIIQIVKQLGGFLFSDSVCETTTHVIAGYPRRTLNVLFGIARGCWILSFDWILLSLENGCWAPEEPFELSTQFPAATLCRIEKQSSEGPYQQDLFVDQPLMFISPQSNPPALMLSKLVQLCGGKVCKTPRKAGICIGRYKGSRPPGNQYLSETWILGYFVTSNHCPSQDEGSRPETSTMLLLIDAA